MNDDTENSGTISREVTVFRAMVEQSWFQKGNLFFLHSVV